MFVGGSSEGEPFREILAALTYRQLVANPQPKAIKPPGVKGPRSRPGSLAQPPEDRPWRATQSLE